MNSRRAITVAATGVLLVSLTGVVCMVRLLDTLRAGASTRNVLYIPSPTLVKRFSLGFGGLLADIYWTRVVQYFGRKHHERSMEYKLLDPLLDITTTLDPQLLPAYKFGAIFLAQQPPEGAGDPDRAVALVQKGIRANPGSWRLYCDLGYIEYIERKDYAAAARAFQRGSEIPGALPWMKIMAAVMHQHGGEVETSRFLWQNIYESTEDKMVRENAVKHLFALQVDEAVPYLEALVRQYHENTGKTAGNWFEMIAAGYLKRVPTDPLGKPFKLTPDGRVEVQDADSLPFITRGLPPGRKAPTTYKSESK